MEGTNNKWPEFFTATIQRGVSVYTIYNMYSSSTYTRVVDLYYYYYFISSSDAETPCKRAHVINIIPKSAPRKPHVRFNIVYYYIFIYTRAIEL